MFLLAIASWAIFLRPVKATMPRIYVFRAIVLTLVSICCGTFWLFYVVQVTEGMFSQSYKLICMITKF